MSGVVLASALLMLVGLVGIVLPVLPGLILVWAGVALWASETSTTASWVVLGIATALLAAGMALQFALPGRRMKAKGVPRRTMLAGAGLAFVGFFVVPVVGLVAGFVLGVYLAERARLRSHQRAWPATVAALKAVGLSMGIELLTGVAIAATWIVGVVALAPTG